MNTDKMHNQIHRLSAESNRTNWCKKLSNRIPAPQVDYRYAANMGLNW